MPFEQNEVNVNSNAGPELQTRLLTDLINPELLNNFQIIPGRVRNIENDKIRIVFFNDLPNDAEVQRFKDINFQNQFHHFVFISDWQYQQFVNALGFPLNLKSSIIEPGFSPIQVDWEAKKNALENNMEFCYTSSPQRGLGILVPAFDNFAKTHPDVHLTVFSSFKIYGRPDLDKQFEPLFQQIIDHPKMTYKGFTDHDELIEYLKTSHVFSYPCIWPEVSCKAMEEAMSAGLLCVHPNVAALPATSGALNQMYQFDVNPNNHVNIFGFQLNRAYDNIKNNYDNVISSLQFTKFYADNRFNITKCAYIWNNLLNMLAQAYPSADSRVIPDKILV